MSDYDKSLHRLSHSAHQIRTPYRWGWGSIPSQQVNFVFQFQGVHALRLISRAGKRV